MPYYHIRVKRIGKRPPYVFEFDLSKKTLETLLEQTRKEGMLFLSESFEWINERDIEDIDIAKTPKKSSHYGIGRLKGISIFEQGKIVTSQFVKKPLSRKAVKKSVAPTQETLSKNVFIVHGRDHKPLKELKTILSDLGLNPIVLHEKASGGLTLAEKLEKYSEDVGYSFIILTPDDIGCEESKVKRYKSELEGTFLTRTFMVSKGYIEAIFKRLKPRARQNVIFEMGYFWGLLKRKKVCCLLKGNVEKPSDIEGIVYIPFKESLNEKTVRSQIIKELIETGYKIEIKKQRKDKKTEERLKEIRKEVEHVLKRLGQISQEEIMEKLKQNQKN